MLPVSVVARISYRRVFVMMIPTARGIDHIGYTVPNLEGAVEFFTTHLGGELAFYAGPFWDPDGDWMQTNVDLDRTTSLGLAMVRMGADTNIELFQYTSPEQTTVMPPNSDHGGRHFAIYVDDIQAAG